MSRMKRFVPIVVLAVTLIFAAGAVWAWQDVFTGKPEFTPGKDFGYFVWHDNHGWTVKTSTAGDVHVFAGEITSNCRIHYISKCALEPGEYFEKVGHRILRFRLFSSGDKRYFNFATNGSKVSFHLHLDGAEVPLDKVFLGAGKATPKELPILAERPSKIW